MRRASNVIIAVVGTIVVSAYAALMVAIVQVLNPLAAAPGLTLGEIAAIAASRSEPIFTPFPAIMASVGVALALVVFLAGVFVRRFTPWWVTISYLALIALGLPAYWFAGFGPGMSVADTFATSGGDHSGLDIILQSTSAVAAFLAVGMSVGMLQPRRVRAVT
jgi:hypothetical protein